MNAEHLKALLGPGGCLSEALAQGDEVVLRVAGGCMEPDVADRTTVRLDRPRFFLPGDVVAFHAPDRSRLFVHRFLGYVWRRGAWHLMTRADRGDRPDPLLERSCVLGRVIAQDGRPCPVSRRMRVDAVRRFAALCVHRIVR